MPTCGCCGGAYPCRFCESGTCSNCCYTFSYKDVRDRKSFEDLIRQLIMEEGLGSIVDIVVYNKYDMDTIDGKAFYGLKKYVKPYNRYQYITGRTWWKKVKDFLGK